MLENLKSWWHSLEKGQKYSLIVSLVVLTLLPTSLLAFKYQRVFFSKAADNNSGVVAVIDTASNDEYTNSASPQTVPNITSAVVRLRITFPANLQSFKGNINLAQSKNAASKVLGENTVTCSSLGGKCGNENYVINGGGSCTSWEHSKGDSAGTYPDCTGNYAYCYTNCSGGSTTATSPTTVSPQSSQPATTGSYCCGDNNRRNASGGYCNGTYDQNNLYCGACGSGTYSVCYKCQLGELCTNSGNALSTPAPAGPALTEAGSGSGVYCCGDNNRKTATGAYCNGSYDSNNLYCGACGSGTYSVCYNCTLSDQNNGLCKAGSTGSSVFNATEGALCDINNPQTCESSNGLYCRSFDDNPAKYVTKADALSRCENRQVKKVQSCNPVSYYICQNGQYKVATADQLRGLAATTGDGGGRPSCCASDANCNDPSLYCDMSEAHNSDCGYQQPFYCKSRSGGQPTSGPAPTTPAVSSLPEGAVCDPTLANQCGVGLGCVRTGEMHDGRCRNNVQAAPLFTRLLLIKNEVGDFGDSDTYTSFSYTDDQAAQNAGKDLIIPYYALSDGEGGKTVTIRFCPTTSPSDNRCKEVSVAVNLTYPKTTPPAVQSVDAGVNGALDKLRQLGKNVTLTDNGFTISDGTVNLPSLNQIPDEDLEYLVYVLKAKLKIHPYFALCQYFTSAQDIKRLTNFLDKYGVGSPLMPAVWNAAQLQAINDPRFAAAQQYMPDGRGPMMLPCRFDASRLETYAIFPRLANAPPQFNRNDLALQGTGLDLVAPDPSDSNQVNNFGQKLAAYVALEQLTWQAADIPIGKAVDWAIKMADLMPIMGVTGSYSFVWQYILPGETISEALNLRDKGAPLGYVGAKYGDMIFFDLALLVGPQAVEGIEGKVASRISVNLSEQGTKIPAVVIPRTGDIFTVEELAQPEINRSFATLIKDTYYNIVSYRNPGLWRDLSKSIYNATRTLGRLPVRAVSDRPSTASLLNYLLDSQITFNGQTFTRPGLISLGKAFVLDLDHGKAKMLLGILKNNIINFAREEGMGEEVIRAITDAFDSIISNNRIIIMDEEYFAPMAPNAAAFAQENIIVINSASFYRNLTNIPSIHQIIAHEMMHIIQNAIVYKGIKKFIPSGQAASLSEQEIQDFATLFTASMELFTDEAAFKFAPSVGSGLYWRHFSDLYSALIRLKNYLSDSGTNIARYNQLERANIRFGTDLDLKSFVTSYIGEYDIKKFVTLLREKGVFDTGSLTRANMDIVLENINTEARRIFIAKLRSIGIPVGAAVGTAAAEYTAYKVLYEQSKGNDVPQGTEMFRMTPEIDFHDTTNP